MSSAVKTYRPVPNTDVPPPPDGPIALGSLLAKPKNPMRSLNKDHRIPIPLGSVLAAHKENYKLTGEQCREGQGGLWASFLQMIVGFGGDVQVKRGKNTIDIMTCERLETQSFQPDDTYIYNSLQNTNVQTYLDAGYLTKPVYMITGLKIARGVTVETSQGAQYGVEGKLGVDGTSAGVPLAAGPSGKWSSKTSESIKFSGSSDFVWTYRLIKIRSLKKGKISEDDYNNGALYDGALYDTDKTEEEDGGPNDLRKNWEITSDESPGTAIPSTLDENGETCKFVSSGDD